MTFDPFASKAVQLDPGAHPGAMIALMLTPEQQAAITADIPGRLAQEADHCTICYVAEDAASMLAQKPALVTALAELATRISPIEAQINGYGAFAGNADEYPLILLVDSPDLPGLYHEVCEAVAAAGITMEPNHGFTPHVTLSYLPASQALPRFTRPSTPLVFDSLSLVWAGERIDLPLLGGSPDQSQFAGETMEDHDEQPTPSAEDVEAARAQMAMALGLDPNSPEGRAVARKAAPSLVPPKAMRAAARDGLRRHEAGESGDGLKPATVARAKRIAAGEALTPEHVREMAAWFARHDKTRPEGGAEGTPWLAAWQLWGGDAGMRWSQRVAEQLDAGKALGGESGPAGAYLVAEEAPEDEDEEAQGETDKALARAYGEPVKSLAANPYRLRTRGIVWGGYDLLGDKFVRGETDLGASRSFVGMPVYWDHAVAGSPIKSQIGTVVYADEDDQGITFEIELDRSRRYVDDIVALERAGALGSSTGAINYLVKRRNGTLKRWICGEISLTPEPIEPRTHAALAAKSIDGASAPAIAPQEATTMGDTPQTAEPGEIAQLKNEVKALSEENATLRGRVESIGTDLDAIKSAPARTPEQLGGKIGGGLQSRKDEYDEDAHSYHNFKAMRTFSYAGGPAKQTRYPEGVFGGFIKALFDLHKPNPAIYRDAMKAMTEVYGSDPDDPAAKALGTQAGAAAAYLIPEQFIPSLMMIAAQKDVFYGRTMVIPSDGGEMVIPALDLSSAYVEGQSAYYGGVTVTWSNDDASTTDTTPSFGQVRLKTNALKASTRVKNQLMMRSALAIDAVVSNLLGGAIGRARDYACIRGTGQGQPLGFMFSPAAIDQGGSAIDFATLAQMNDNTIPEADDDYMWLIHSKKRSSIWSLQQTNNALVTFLPDLRGKPGTQLLGRQVAFTDKTPYASGDVSNTVNLVNPGMYVVSEFQGIAVAVSDQARFEQDETVIRAIMSVDGQPWLKSKVAVTSTPDYVSGFVTI